MFSGENPGYLNNFYSNDPTHRNIVHYTRPLTLASTGSSNFDCTTLNTEELDTSTMDVSTIRGKNSHVVTLCDDDHGTVYVSGTDYFLPVGFGDFTRGFLFSSGQPATFGATIANSQPLQFGSEGSQVRGIYVARIAFPNSNSNGLMVVGAVTISSNTGSWVPIVSCDKRLEGQYPDNFAVVIQGFHVFTTSITFHFLIWRLDSNSGWGASDNHISLLLFNIA